MEKKVYCIVSVLGRKESIIFETKPFNPADGDADFAAFREARREFDRYKLSLITSGKQEKVEIIRRSI